MQPQLHMYCENDDIRRTFLSSKDEIYVDILNNLAVTPFENEPVSTYVDICFDCTPVEPSDDAQTLGKAFIALLTDGLTVHASSAHIVRFRPYPR